MRKGDSSVLKEQFTDGSALWTSTQVTEYNAQISISANWIHCYVTFYGLRIVLVLTFAAISRF